MGYTTEFEGELLFNEPLSPQEQHDLASMLNEDCRDHPEYIDREDLSYIDLDFNDDFTGLVWNGAEKTYYMERIVNCVIKTMRERHPNFGLSGSILAQGEERGDVWHLVIGDDGFAKRQKAAAPKPSIICDNCGHEVKVS